MGWPSPPLIALVETGYRRCRLLALVVLTTLGALETASGSAEAGVGESEDPKAATFAGGPVPSDSAAAKTHAVDLAPLVFGLSSAAPARRAIAADAVRANRAHAPLGYVATGPPV